MNQITKSDVAVGGMTGIYAFVKLAIENPDIWITRGIGIATFIFTVLKIAQLIKNWNRAPKKDE